jgi:hypothetical protein
MFYFMKNNLFPYIATIAVVSLIPIASFASSYFYIGDDGNVGIGNSTPAHKLDVSGSLVTRLVTVSDAASTTIDWNGSNVQSIVLNTSNSTVTFSNGQAGGEYKLLLHQDATGGRIVTWPTSVLWPNNIPPTLTTDASTTDTVSFLYDGTNYYGTYSLGYGKLQQIAFDSSGTCGANTGSCSLTNTAGDLMIIGDVGETGSGTTPTCSWNGTAATLIDSAQEPTDRWVYDFYITNPSTGTHTLQCTSSSYNSISMVTYSGAKLSGQPDSHSTQQPAGTSTSYSATSTVDSAWAVLFQYGTTNTAGSNTTRRGSVTSSSAFFDNATAIHPAGSVTLNVNNTSSATQTGLVLTIAPNR